MVEGIPYIRIKTSAEAAYVKPSHDKRWATVVETTKGPINKPTFIESKLHAKQIFGFNADPFFDNGGTGLILVRANSDYVEKDSAGVEIENSTNSIVAKEGTTTVTGNLTYTIGVAGEGNTVTAETKTLTDADFIKLTTNYKGSCPVRIEFSKDIRGEYKFVVKSLVFGNEAEFIAGKYENCTTDVLTIQRATTLAKIVEKINKRSYAINAVLTDEGALFDKLSDTTNIKPLGTSETIALNQITEATVSVNLINSLSNTKGMIQGSNGLWDSTTQRIPNIADNIEDKAYAGRKAHETALHQLEDERLAGVFCVYPDWDIQNKYAEHSEKMSADDVCKWRYACIGANEDDRLADAGDLEDRARLFDNQYVIYIGQGMIDYDGKEILPYKVTMYWAGLRSKLSYGNSMYGGEDSKILYSWSTIEGKKEPIAGVMPLLSTDDEVRFEPEVYVKLNEAGVVTVKKEYDTVTFREGVTTSQSTDYTSEESVVNIVKYALNTTYDICYGYQGKNINVNLKTSLEEAIKSALSDMKIYDNTLQDVDTDSLKAYDVEVIITPRSEQRVGRIHVNLKLTPIYALRQVEASIIVQ